MVVHWKRTGGSSAKGSMLLNGVGALSSGVVLCIILVAKFIDGAWITVLLIPALVLLMLGVRHHYRQIERETDEPHPANFAKLPKPLAIVPIERWSKVSDKALHFAYSIAEDVEVVHIVVGDADEKDIPESDLRRVWTQYVEEPANKPA